MQIGDCVIIRDFVTNDTLLSGHIVNITDNPSGIALSSNKFLFVNPNSTKLIIEKCDFVNDIDLTSKLLDQQQTYIVYKHNNIDNTFEYDFFMWNEIEPEVKETCELLNRLSFVETYSSCCGHGKIPAYIDFHILNYDKFFDFITFLNENGIHSYCSKHNEIEDYMYRLRFLVGVEGKGTCHLELVDINENFIPLNKAIKKFLTLV